MAKKDMGDSGHFGPAMKTVKNSLYKEKTVAVKAKPAMPKVKVAAQGGRGLQPTGSVKTNSSDRINENINQGAFKGAKLRNVKTKSGTNRMQR